MQLSEHPVHLGLGAQVCSEPPFTGMEWYPAYAARHAGDGDEGRLVSMHTFSEPWPHWEMHPHGHELVVCTAGELTLLQELEGRVQRTLLRCGEYAINPPGVWHCAEVDAPATALFITSGRETQHRPRVE